MAGPEKSNVSASQSAGANDLKSPASSSVGEVLVGDTHDSLGPRLASGSYLPYSKYLLSSNEKYFLRITTEGDVILQEKLGKDLGKVLWNSKSRDPKSPGIKLIVKEDGEVVLLDNKGNRKWGSQKRRDPKRNSYLVIDDSGRAIASCGTEEIWKNPIEETDNKPGPSPKPVPPGPTPKPDDDGSSSTPPKPADVEVLRGGSSLAVGQRLISPNKKYWLSINSNGNFGVSTSEGFIWKATSETLNNTTGPLSATLKSNGELVLLTKEKIKAWSSKSDDKNTTDTILVMQNDGHAVISSNGERVWYSDRPKDLSINKDKLVAGEWLQPGQALVSGDLRLLLQKNGEFVLFRNTEKLWPAKAITVPTTNDTRVILRDDDNLWIGSQTQPAWTSNTRRRKNGGDAVLRVADFKDGAAAVIESEGITLWSTNRPTTIKSWEPRRLLAADPNSDQVRSGQFLTVNQNIYSRNRKYYAFIQSDGIYVRKVDKPSINASSFRLTNKETISRLWLGWDGNMVLAGTTAVPIWESKTANLIDESALVMRDDGKLDLQDLRQGAWSLAIAISP